jgi:hypothetical protein
MSVEPPGGNGTSRVTGLAGQAWASAPVAAGQAQPRAVRASSSGCLLGRHDGSATKTGANGSATSSSRQAGRDQGKPVIRCWRARRSKSRCRPPARPPARPSARSTMNCAAWRPMAAPLMCTVVSAGLHVGGEFQVAEADHGQPPGTARPRAPRLGQHAQRQQVGTAEHRVDAGASLRQQLGQRLAAALQRGGRGHLGSMGTSGSPSAAARLEGLAAAPRAFVVAGHHRQAPAALGVQEAATARPTSTCEKPTSMSIGVGVRSQVSTTGMPGASSRRGPRPNA